MANRSTWNRDIRWSMYSIETINNFWSTTELNLIFFLKRRKIVYGEKESNLNMRSFATWKVIRRDISEIELTVSSCRWRFQRREWSQDDDHDDSDTARACALFSFSLIKRCSHHAKSTGVELTNSCCRLIFKWKRKGWSISIEIVRHLLIHFWLLDSLRASHRFFLFRCWNNWRIAFNSQHMSMSTSII